MPPLRVSGSRQAELAGDVHASIICTLSGPERAFLEYGGDLAPHAGRDGDGLHTHPHTHTHTHPKT